MGLESGAEIAVGVDTGVRAVGLGVEGLGEGPLGGGAGRATVAGCADAGALATCSPGPGSSEASSPPHAAANTKNGTNAAPSDIRKNLRFSPLQLMS